MKLSVERFVRSRPAIREPIRHFLTRLAVHRKGNLDDILVLAGGRSGSTWLMEVIAAEPGMKFVNEPFHPIMLNRAGLPTGLETSLPWHFRKILDVPLEAEDQFRSYLLDDRATQIKGPYNVFSPDFHWITNRRILKEVTATAIGEWIDDQKLGFKIVYLIRHPLPTALSWGQFLLWAQGNILPAQAHLLHPVFRKKFLNGGLYDYAWSVLRDGSDLEKYVLEWCLQNLAPLRAIQSGRDWIVITYEELVLSPVLAIHWLADRLQLRHPDRLTKGMGVPSATTDPKRIKLIQQESAIRRVQEWRSKVSLSLEKRALEIPREFGIHVYEVGSYVAREEFLHFAETPRLREPGLSTDHPVDKLSPAIERSAAIRQ
jgi:hypothetical protein